MATDSEKDEKKNDVTQELMTRSKVNSESHKNENTGIIEDIVEDIIEEIVPACTCVCCSICLCCSRGCSKCWLTIFDSNWDEVIRKLDFINKGEGPIFKELLNQRIERFMVQKGIPLTANDLELKTPEFRQSVKNAAMEIEYERIGNRLSEYFSLIGNIASLVAGFTYIVSNSDEDFTKSPLIDVLTWKLDRQYVFVVFVTIAFMLSLMATILNAVLYGILYQVGTRNSRWFIKKFMYFIGIPNTLTIISIIAMLITVVLDVGGIGNEFLRYFVQIIIFIAVVIVFVTYQIYSRHTYNFIVLGQVNRGGPVQRFLQKSKSTQVGGIPKPKNMKTPAKTI